MKYFWSILTFKETPDFEGIAVHALDPKSGKLYTYSQELKTWHLDPKSTNHYQTLDPPTRANTYEEISHHDLYSLLPLVARMDRRNTSQRQISNRQRSQVRKSGQVCTSAEMGLLTKPLKQRPTTIPWLKEMVETRSQHKRWTALFLYEEDGQTRRKAVSDLRNNADLARSSRGHQLEVQHRKKRFIIDGHRQTFIAVEIKYVRSAPEGENRE